MRITAFAIQYLLNEHPELRQDVIQSQSALLHQDE